MEKASVITKPWAGPGEGRARTGCTVNPGTLHFSVVLQELLLQASRSVSSLYTGKGGRGWCLGRGSGPFQLACPSTHTRTYLESPPNHQGSASTLDPFFSAVRQGLALGLQPLLLLPRRLGHSPSLKERRFRPAGM